MELADELKRLFEEDQEDRFGRLYESDPKQFVERDKERLTRARELLSKCDTMSPEGKFYLAMLFQHGQSAEDYKHAFELATQSADGGYEPARWLSAAAEDRHLLSLEKKQKWGTQFRLNEQGEYERQPMMSDEESGVTDKLRAEKDVPPRSEQVERFKQQKKKTKS